MARSAFKLLQQLPVNVLCFSHLRWKFVFQRPQHLLTRYASQATITFFEEPVYEDCLRPSLVITIDDSGVRIATPRLPIGIDSDQAISAQRLLIDQYVADQGITEFVSWYYTPMAVPFTRHLPATLTVYDCMDELSAFDSAPPQLLALERELFSLADVVFTGGQSLYTAKRGQHANVHAFPSSVDHAHFGAGRQCLQDPPDQIAIPHPRIGFFGVLDERLDRELLGAVAERRPDWHLVLIGPTAKIRFEDLPAAPNLHYLGGKSYAELPRYLSNWDVAMLPFARNDSTRFISPTKTPEYLAAAKPVVSTPIHDVVHPYGDLDLVHIAEDADEFCRAIEACLAAPRPGWLTEVDEHLARNSWDKTFEGMMAELARGLKHRRYSADADLETNVGLNDSGKKETSACLIT